MTRFSLLLTAVAAMACASAHAAPPTGAQASPGKSASIGTPGASGSAGAVPSCPGDRPVWVNERSGAYHAQGDRLFGHTKHGKYLCEAAAKAAGDHLAKGK